MNDAATMTTISDDIAAIAQGAVEGLAGTATMTVVLFAAQGTGIVSRFPPERIASSVLRDTVVPAPDEHRGVRDVFTAVSHIGYGMTAGAAFEVLRRRLHVPGNPIVQGLIYGTALWAFGYKGWARALGLIPAVGVEPGRPLTMIPGHWVYGATLGAVAARVEHDRLQKSS